MSAEASEVPNYTWKLKESKLGASMASTVADSISVVQDVHPRHDEPCNFTGFPIHPLPEL